MPRYYTIASSSLAHPHEVAMAISLTDWKQEDGTTRQGLTSAFFQDLFASGTASGATVKGFVKSSAFVMPKSTETPIVMVGPGTGVVPFIGFMQERQKLRDEQNQQLGEAHMYFGCRQKDSDFIYRDFMAQMHDSKVISELNLAFSREQSQPKQYVQDLLAQHKEMISDLLVKQKGYFYICGSTSMGQEVQKLLRETLGAEFEAVNKENRLLVELWSS